MRSHLYYIYHTHLLPLKMQSHRLVLTMQIPINSPQDLGLVIRATRRAQKVRLDDLSGCAGVGHVFTRDAEHGKETIQLGRVMRLLDELGIRLLVDMPNEANGEFARLQQTGLRPTKRSARRMVATEGKD